MTRLSLLLAIALCSIPLRAVAEPSPAARAQAKEHYEAGENAFRLGDFDRAISEWRHSYELSSVPLLLYNIAQAYRQKGDAKQALFFYQQYLATGPTGDSREIAEKRVDELKQVLAAQQKAQSAPPQGPVPPSSPTPAAPTPPPISQDASSQRWYATPLGWTLGAGGIAVGIAGVGFLVHGNDLNSQIPSATSLAQAQQLGHDRDSFRTAGEVMIAIGSAALVAGVVVFAVRAAHRRSPRFSWLPVDGGVFVGGAL